jgi:hypothetical protein
MISETDRVIAERWAWWFLADTASDKMRESGSMDWWLSFEVPPIALSDEMRDDLLLRTWRRMQEYKAGADYEPSVEDYAEWIGLDLGGMFESAGKLMQALVELAIEHGRGCAS